MDKNNLPKQKSSLYLLKSKENMLRFICIKTRQYLEKQHFTKENKLLPCSKPGPPHLAFNHNERSCTLVRGLLLVLLFIWNTSECIVYSTMPRPQRAKTWRRFLLCFLRRRKTEFTRDDDGPTSRQVSLSQLATSEESVQVWLNPLLRQRRKAVCIMLMQPEYFHARPYLELLSVLSDIDLVWVGYMNWTISGSSITATLLN